MGRAESAVIAVYSPKGGVGKTTLAVDLAWRCAVQGGHRTLLWDLDSQGGAAFLLNVEPKRRLVAAGVFQKEGRPGQLITPTPYQRLSLLCADESLRALPLQLARLGRRHRLAEIAGRLGYDFDRIVLDCPPMQNEVSEQILQAADVLILPLPPSPLSARALDMLQQDLLNLGGRHPPILPVMAMYDSRRKEHRRVREEHMARYPVVPLSSQIEQTAFRQAPIGTFAPNCAPAMALQALWRGIENKLVSLRPKRTGAEGGLPLSPSHAPRELWASLEADSPQPVREAQSFVETGY